MNAHDSMRKLVLALALLTACFSAFAYNTFGRWPGNSATINAYATSFPPGNAYRTALGTVVSRWNANPSNFFFIQRYDDPSVSLGNGQSEVWFSTDGAYNPAVTFWWTDVSTGRIRETDIIFYTGERYIASMNKTLLIPYGGLYRPFETTAMHEYGHALGLLHEADEYNLMGEDYTHLSLNGQTARSYSGEDANDGVISLYGSWSGGQREDLGAVHWRRIGASGEYSTHGMTKMFSSTGVELPYTIFNGQRRYNVNKGQRVRVQFTYENNGESPQNAAIGFFISSNSTISRTDARIATASMRLVRDNVSTTSHTITIPNWVRSGSTYYLGTYVDWNNVIAENTEANNTAYHIIRINY